MISQAEYDALREHGPNEKQQAAMRRFWKRARPKGWKYIKNDIKLFKDGTWEIGFRAANDNYHLIRFSVDGDCVPAPMTMGAKCEW